MTIIDISRYKRMRGPPPGRYSGFRAGDIVEQGASMGHPGLAGRLTRFVASSASRDIFGVVREDGRQANVSHIHLRPASPESRVRLAVSESSRVRASGSHPEVERDFLPGKHSGFQIGAAVQRGPRMPDPGMAGRIYEFIPSNQFLDFFAVMWEDGTKGLANHLHLFPATADATARLYEAETRMRGLWDRAPDGPDALDEPYLAPAF